MQEVVKKIVSALEEYKYNDLIDRDSEICNHCKQIDCKNGTDCSLCIMDKVIEIVKKAAGEHKCTRNFDYCRKGIDEMSELYDLSKVVTSREELKEWLNAKYEE